MPGTCSAGTERNRSPKRVKATLRSSFANAMPVLKKLLPLLALLPHAAGTSMKIDYLRLANVRTDPITDPDGLSPHVHSFYGATEAAPGTTYEKLRAAAGNTGAGPRGNQMARRKGCD